jgi:hypothetical protein
MNELREQPFNVSVRLISSGTKETGQTTLSLLPNPTTMYETDKMIVPNAIYTDAGHGSLFSVSRLICETIRAISGPGRDQLVRLFGRRRK